MLVLMARILITDNMKIKGIIFRVTAALMVLLLLSITEGVLRILDIPKHGKLFHHMDGMTQFSRGAALRYFSAGADNIPEAYPETFNHPKKEGFIRIICLGGSTMAGYPYSYNGTLPSLIRDALLQRNETLRVEVLNFAIPAVGSYTVRDLCRHSLEYEPDIIVIYTGHNEFYGALGGASTQKIADKRFIQLHLRLQDLHLYRLLWHGMGFILRSGFKESRAPTLMARMVDRSVIRTDSQLYKRTLEQFSRNIEALYAMCAGKTELIFCEVVSNLRDQPPFESYDVPYEQMYHFADSAASPSDSSISGREIFDEARYEENNGDYGKARVLYGLSRDLDGLRFRASSELNDTLRTITQRFMGHLVHLESIFAERSIFVSPGYDLFIDHLHPNHHGYLIMAEVISYKIEETLGELGTYPQMLWEDYKRQECEEMALVTPLDQAIAVDKIRRLMNYWPFSPDQPRPVFAFDESIEVLARRYHDQDIAWSEIHLEASSFHMRHKRYGAARREAQAILKQAMGFWPAWMKVGDSFLGEGSYDMALSSYQYAIAWAERTDASTGPIRAKYASALLAAGKTEKAARAFEEILTDNDTLTGIGRLRALYMQGLAYIELKNSVATRKIIRELRFSNQGAVLADKLEARM